MNVAKVLDSLERRVARLTNDAGTSEGARKAAETRKRGGGSFGKPLRGNMAPNNQYYAQRIYEGRMRSLNKARSKASKDARRTVDALEKRLTLLTLKRRLQKAEDARDFLPIDGTRK